MTSRSWVLFVEMNKRVLARRLEKCEKKHLKLKALVEIGAITPDEAKEEMTLYLKKHLAVAFRLKKV